MSLIATERAVGYALRKPRMTADEYLAWDAGQTEKTEFIAGEVFAMAGPASAMSSPSAICWWPCASTCAAARVGRSPTT